MPKCSCPGPPRVLAKQVWSRKSSWEHVRTSHGLGGGGLFPAVHIRGPLGFLSTSLFTGDIAYFRKEGHTFLLFRISLWAVLHGVRISQGYKPKRQHLLKKIKPQFLIPHNGQWNTTTEEMPRDTLGETYGRQLSLISCRHHTHGKALFLPLICMNGSSNAKWPPWGYMLTCIF